jgi:hypothetical protein
MAEPTELQGQIDMLDVTWGRIYADGRFYHFWPAQDWCGGGAPVLGQTVHFTAVRGVHGAGRARNVRP